MEPRNDNFLDKKTLLAIVIMGLTFFAWQTYMARKYPTPKAGVTTTTVPGTTPAAIAEAATPGTPAAQINAPTPSQPETLIPGETNIARFQVSSVGMGLKDYHLKEHTDRSKNAIVMGKSDKGTLFETRLLGTNQIPHFQITQKSPTSFEGVAQTEQGTIKKNLDFDVETGAINQKIMIENPSAKFEGLALSLVDQKMNIEKTSMLMPSFEHQDFIVSHDGTLDRVAIKVDSSIDQSFNTVSMLGIGSQYFVTAVLDRSPLIPQAKVLSGLGPDLAAELIYKPTTASGTIELNSVLYAGSKSLSTLQKIDPEMARLINFGWFATIAKWLLYVLQWFHQFVNNWGVAIILLTLLARLLVLPFNVASYRSMKKMQKIQPLLASLREKYKDEPQSLNREMMVLMKEHQVNPIGGCLPMLLQMPIFFALYQVLGQSIELYQAPFFGWIHDLSLKDPFYILPVLMAITMFIQQKITPTTMDPAQAKILQFLPLVFGFMMLSLPSGLTLYIFISTLFGIVQQQIFMRDRSPTAVPVKN